MENVQLRAKSVLSEKNYSYTYLFIANTCKDYERDSNDDF